LQSKDKTQKMNDLKDHTISALMWKKQKFSCEIKRKTLLKQYIQ